MPQVKTGEGLTILTYNTRLLFMVCDGGYSLTDPRTGCVSLTESGLDGRLYVK